LNSNEYESLSQKEIMSIDSSNKRKSSRTVLSEPGEELEAFEIEEKVTGPLFRRICCFVCGPANLQQKLIFATLFNLTVFALIGVMLAFRALKTPDDQSIFRDLCITSMVTTLALQFLIMYVAFRDPGIITKK